MRSSFSSAYKPAPKAHPSDDNQVRRNLTDDSIRKIVHSVTDAILEKTRPLENVQEQQSTTIAELSERLERVEKLVGAEKANQ